MGAADARRRCAALIIGLPTLTADNYLMSLLRRAFETASDLEWTWSFS